MSYPYEQIFAGDPSAPERVAVNGVVTIFEPGDATMAPLTITTLDGLPLANPMQVNESGFGPAFMHATLDQVAWAGGGFSGLFVSYKGIKDEAVAARRAAEAAVTEVQSPTDASVDRGIQRADIPGQVANQLTNSPILSASISESLKDAVYPAVPDALVNNWNYPTCQYVASPSPRTYFGASGTRGEVVAGYVDHITGDAKRFVVGRTFAVDDHNVGVVSVAPGRATIVSWTEHSRDSFIRVRLSGTAGDLSALGPVILFDTKGPVTYMQWHRDVDNPDSGWVFFRTMPGVSDFYWCGARFTVDSTRGAITFGAVQRLVRFPGGQQGYMFTARKSDTELHLGFNGHPFNSTNNDVQYATMNTKTGDVKVKGVTIGNALTGAGLPLLSADAEVIYSPPAGRKAQLFDIRSGQDPALALSVVNDANLFDYVHVRYTSGTPGMRVNDTRDAAVTPVVHQDSLKLRLLYKLDTSQTSAFQRLAERWSDPEDGSNAFRIWMFTTDNSAQRLRFVYSTNGTSTTRTFYSAPINSAAAGFGVDCDPVAGATTFYQTMDGVSWTALGAPESFPTTLGPFAKSAGTKLRIGGPKTTDATNVAALGNIQRATLYAAVGSDVVLADFAPTSSPWVHSDGAGISRRDSKGNTWTLEGGVKVTVVGWSTVNLGSSGAALFGAAPGISYVHPGREDALHVIRKSGPTWRLERVSKGTGDNAWTTEIVATWQAPPGGVNTGMGRPKAVIGGGPFEVAYINVTNYPDYFNYEGSTRFA